ncbi:hypothetical protein Bbelb_023110 [Branchiostoma belcheri]|nr:hypothetical protein Bbelb_023110 [Branchiostoma belcheri]
MDYQCAKSTKDTHTLPSVRCLQHEACAVWCEPSPEAWYMVEAKKLPHPPKKPTKVACLGGYVDQNAQPTAADLDSDREPNDFRDRRFHATLPNPGASWETLKKGPILVTNKTGRVSKRGLAVIPPAALSIIAARMVPPGPARHVGGGGRFHVPRGGANTARYRLVKS